MEFNVAGYFEIIGDDLIIETGEIKLSEGKYEEASGQLVKRLMFLKNILETLLIGKFKNISLFGDFFTRVSTNFYISKEETKVDDRGSVVIRTWK